MKVVLALWFQGPFTGESSRRREVTLVLLAYIFGDFSFFFLVLNHCMDYFMRVFSKSPLQYKVEMGARINVYRLDLSLMEKKLLYLFSFYY